MRLDSTTGGVSPLKAKGKRGSARHKGGTAEKRLATKGVKRHGGFGESTATHNLPGYNVNTRFKPSQKWTPPGSGGEKQPSHSTPNKPYHYDSKGNMIVNMGDDINTNTLPGKGDADANANIEMEWVEGTPGTKGHWEEETWEIGPGSGEKYSQVWKRKKDKYTGKGQSARMSDDHYKTLNLNSKQEGGYTVHKTYEDYVEYMKASSAWGKTEEGRSWKDKNLSSTKKKTHTQRVYVDGVPGTPGHWVYKSVSASASSKAG